MSTRGAVGIRMNGIDKIGYNHFDSYPIELGQQVLNFVQHYSVEELKDLYNKIKLEKSDNDTWDFNRKEFNLVFEDYHNFLKNSLNCEYAYIINLDNNCLEYYKGFNKDPNAKGRYAKEQIENNLGYYGVALETEIPLDQVKNYEAFEEGDDEGYRIKERKAIMNSFNKDQSKGISYNYDFIKFKVMSELTELLDSFSENQVEVFLRTIINVKNRNGKICGFGAGRMGYGLRAFMMRLNHLGIPAYFIGDTYIPPMNENDLFIVASGSGETKSVLNMLQIAKNKANMKTCAITGNGFSTMAKLADVSVIFRSSNGGLNSADNDDKIDSIQPMTSLNEQGMFVFFDIIAVLLIDILGIKKEDEKKFHFNVE